MHNCKVINNDYINQVIIKDSGKIRALIRQFYALHDNFQNQNMQGTKYADSGSIVLNDCDSGIPIACLDNSIISMTSIAASAILATEIIQRKLGRKLHHIGIIGTEDVAKHIAKHLLQNSTLVQLQSLQIFDANTDRSCEFISEINHFDQFITYSASDNLDKVISESDLIIFASAATKPYFSNLSLLKHNPIILNISLIDLSPDIIWASNNITDDIELVLQTNTSLKLCYEQKNKRSFITSEIGDLLHDTFMLENNKPTIFSPVGLSMLDLILSRHIYQSFQVTNKT